jgi:hypothetical protein
MADPEVIVSKKYVDLTDAFALGIPLWPGFPDETRKTIMLANAVRRSDHREDAIANTRGRVRSPGLQ